MTTSLSTLPADSRPDRDEAGFSVLEEPQFHPVLDGEEFPTWQIAAFDRVQREGELFRRVTSRPVQNTGLCQLAARDLANAGFKIWLGWAVSEGYWVQHTAGYNPITDCLVEGTPAEYTAYWGIVLNEQEKENFVREYEGL